MPTLVRKPDISVPAHQTKVPSGVAPGGDTTVNVFTLGEVAEILEIPKSRIKNWTIGRPLKIVPKVRAYRGKGSRNLYSLQDVYLFAVVSQLHNDGLSSSLIQYVIENAFLGFRLGPIQAIILHRPQGKWGAKIITGRLSWESIMDTAVESRGLYLLHFRALMNQVNERVARFHERS